MESLEVVQPQVDAALPRGLPKAVWFQESLLREHERTINEGERVSVLAGLSFGDGPRPHDSPTCGFDILVIKLAWPQAAAWQGRPQWSR